MGRRSRRWVISLCAIGLAVIVAALAGMRLDPMIGDQLLIRVGDHHEPKSEVVVVAITEETLAGFPYRSPIHRGFLASLINTISQAGPKAIGVDILIDQPSEVAKDDALRRALATASVPVVLATVKKQRLSERQFQFHTNFARGLTLGLATLRRDEVDGVVRDALARDRDGTEWKPGLAAAMAQAVDNVRREDGGMIRFLSQVSGTPHEFPTYPAHTVRHLPAKWFKGKFVLIGATLPGTDSHRTPFATVFGSKTGTLFGVHIHAHLLSQYLDGRQLRRLVGPSGALISLILVILIALCLRPQWALSIRIGLCAILLFGYWALVWWAFRDLQLVLPAGGPTVAVFVGGALFGLWAWRRDRASRRRIERAFSQYVSPAVVKRIVDRRAELVLGGERRDVTCIFTDLAGFTSMSEGLDPGEVATLLNAYLDRLCNKVLDAGATIDKIIGDAVVAFFGAPEDQKDQSARAVDLALALDREAEDFRAEWAEKGVKIGETRIGVHRGVAIVGNFGGSRFFDYTAIGDTVNTAARLESANRHLGTRICVSAVIVAGSPDHTFRPAGALRLKGKSRPVDCFEPLHPDRAEDPVVDGYRAAYDALASGDPAATDAFSEIRRKAPDDPLAALHHDRLLAGKGGVEIVLEEK